MITTNLLCPHGRQLNEPCQDCAELDRIGRRVADRIMQLEVQNERLRKALEPFAIASSLLLIEPKIRTLPIEAEYLRAARDALESEE